MLRFLELEKRLLSEYGLETSRLLPLEPISRLPRSPRSQAALPTPPPSIELLHIPLRHLFLKPSSSSTWPIPFFWSPQQAYQVVRERSSFYPSLSPYLILNIDLTLLIISRRVRVPFYIDFKRIRMQVLWIPLLLFAAPFCARSNLLLCLSMLVFNSNLSLYVSVSIGS